MVSRPTRGTSLRLMDSWAIRRTCPLGLAFRRIAATNHVDALTLFWLLDW
jgi:hypothetical protein